MNTRTKILRLLVFGCFCASAVGWAVGQSQQATAGTMAFEVVSIKPSMAARLMTDADVPGRDTYEVDYVSLLGLVTQAYGLAEGYQVIGLPEWAKSAHYDVIAKVSSANVDAFQKIGRERTNRMLQPVLEERFGLHCHGEKRVLPSYSLTLIKKSSALKEATAADDKNISMGQLNFGPGSIVTLPGGLLISRAAPMSMLADQLQGELHEVVVDETGLKGNYDYQMQLPQASAGATSGAGGSPAPEPSQEIPGSLYQIGLKLVHTKTELPVFVVDSIQAPSSN